MSDLSEELPELIERLKISSDEQTVKLLLENITEKLHQHLENSSELVSQLEQIAASNVATSVIIHACKSIAELAKTPEGRAQCCQSKSLVATIANHLGSPDMELASQACRALGNLCYENDDGRKIVISAGCLPVLIKMLKKGLDEKEKGKQLRNTASGFLLNLLMDQEELQTQAFRLGIMPILNQLLQVDGTDHETESCANHTLLILGLFTDSEIGGSEGKLLDDTLCKTIVSLLGAASSPELSEMCLELLHGQSDNELVKMRMARAGLCELLVALIDTHKGQVDSDDKRNLLKLACDLIVLVLTGDESMDILYQESKGKLFHSMIKWLQDPDEDLKITAVLAMGNFARTDKHCTEMVEAGVATKLLEIVRKNNTSKHDIRLQHALLSALRNLVIPASNKSTILKAGLVEAVLPMLEIPAFPVVFKLLGTLRIVIDGQVEAAKHLGVQETLIQRLVDWCGTQDHPGVQGEASRLLAWLAKHSRDQKVVKTLVKLGALPPLVRMIDTEHPVMQNEALVALNLFALLALEESENDLIKNELGQKIIALIKKYTDKTNSPQTESLHNILTLITQLLQSKKFKSHFIDNDIKSSIISLKSLENMPDLDNKLNTMNKLLNSA